ncbi:MAG: VanZ family protein [Coriobacteriia bacterium]
MLSQLLGMDVYLLPVSSLLGSVLFWPTIIALVATAARFYRTGAGGTRTFFALVFVLYLSVLVEIAFFPLPFDFQEMALLQSSASYIRPEANLIPFRTIFMALQDVTPMGIRFMIRNFLGNFLLLLPLGLLMPMLLPNFSHSRRAFAFVAATAFSLEFLQFLGTFLVFRINWRVVDVDDILLNILGGMLGFLCYKTFSSARHRLKPERQ